MKSIISAAAVLLFLASSGSSDVYGQTVGVTFTYPTGSTSFLRNSTASPSGYISKLSGNDPDAVKVTIEDSVGHTYVGTGGCTPIVGMPGRWSFSVAVFIPSTASIGTASCKVEVSTNGGTTYNAGSAISTGNSIN